MYSIHFVKTKFLLFASWALESRTDPYNSNFTSSPG